MFSFNFNFAIGNRHEYIVELYTNGNLTLSVICKTAREAIHVYNTYIKTISHSKHEVIVLKEDNKIVAKYDNRDIITQAQSNDCLSIRD